MKKITTVMAALLAVGTMSGCSWLNPGEEEFACSGMPGSVFCHSARDVYEKTNSGLVPSPINGNTYNENCTDCVRAEDENPQLRDGYRDSRDSQTVANSRRTFTNNTGVEDDEIINNYVTPNIPNRPVPVRTPAQIMRIWVGPYVDANGDLVAPGIVYTEIEPRKWIYPDSISAANSANNRVMRPLSQASVYTGGTDPAAYNNKQQGEFSALKRFGSGQSATQRKLSK